MKQALYFIASIIILCMTSSCMQNNGYIGDLFGQWRLENICHDNVVEECDTVFFAFQSDVMQIQKVDYLTYERIAATGLYTHQDGSIKVNLYNYYGQEVTTEAQTARLLRFLESLHIEDTAPLFVVEKLSWNEMVLQYNDYRYTFSKLD